MIRSPKGLAIAANLFYTAVNVAQGKMIFYDVCASLIKLNPQSEIDVSRVIWPFPLFECSSNLTVQVDNLEFLVIDSVFKLLSERSCLSILMTLKWSHIWTPQIILLALSYRCHAWQPNRIFPTNVILSWNWKYSFTHNFRVISVSLIHIDGIFLTLLLLIIAI